MKKNFISVALFVVLATMAVSCQKENLVEPQSTTHLYLQQHGLMEMNSVMLMLL